MFQRPTSNAQRPISKSLMRARERLEHWAFDVGRWTLNLNEVPQPSLSRSPICARNFVPRSLFKSVAGFFLPISPH
jgi:hypothetical protein